MDRRRWAVMAALAAAVAGCTSGGGTSRLQVSAAAGPAAPAASGGIVAGEGITVERVRLLVQRIELQAEDSSGPGSGGVEVGPFLVDLAGDALAGGVRQTFDQGVPAGTYRKLELRIGPGSALDGHAVVVDGTIDGAPFTFSSELVAEQEHELTLTVADDGSSGNVALVIDPTGWFTLGGMRLDPRDPAARSAIEAQLAASIDAFEDEDEDGHDDHGGDGGHGGDDGGGGNGGGSGDDGPGHM